MKTIAEKIAQKIKQEFEINKAKFADSNSFYSDDDLEKIANHPSDPMEGIRTERNRLLSLSDWTQVSDVALSDNEKLLWKNYRQELRDITEKFSNPSDVVWPKNPGIN